MTKIIKIIKKILNFIGIKQPYLLYKFNKEGPFFWVDEKLTLKFAKTFLDYLNNEKYINGLKKNLDKESLKVINKTLVNINLCLTCDIIKENKLFSNEDYSDRFKCTKINGIVKNMHIKLPVKHFETSVFFYNQGINSINNLNSFVEKKDILDCGGYIGDSSLLFSKKLKPNKIYCFEPGNYNHKLLLNTIKKNNLDGKIIPIKYGVSNKEGELYVNNEGEVSTVVNKKDKGVEKINITTIDKYVFENNLNPGLIKRDIEGMELESVKGAEKTIKKFKPKLIIAVYHTGKDFFEIKPLIESWNLGYKFKLKHMNPFHPRFETFLICY